MNTKNCTKCLVEKPLSDFHANSAHPTGRRSQCKKCGHAYEVKSKDRRNLYLRGWRKKHFAKNQSTWRKYTYGITSADYEIIYASQSGRCAICMHIPLPGKPLQIDHNHSTGMVRGLLCKKCNTYIGMIGESMDTISRMREYLLPDRTPPINHSPRKQRVAA